MPAGPAGPAGAGTGTGGRYAWASEDEDSELSSDGEGVIFGTSPPPARPERPRAGRDPPQESLKSLGRDRGRDQGRGRAPGAQAEQLGDGGLDAGAPEPTPSASEPEVTPSASEPEATPSASEPEPVFRAMTASKLRQSLRRSFSDELELERAKTEGPGDGGGGPPPGVKATSGASSPWANLDRILAGIETAQRSSGKMGALYARLRELQGIHLGLTGHEEELRLAHAGLAAERRHYLALLRRIEAELVPNDHLDDADKRLGGRLEDIIYSVDESDGAVHLVGAKGRAIDYRALSARGVLDARLLRLVLDRGA